jgi:uncharacterized protein involved in cysteine biosynthesis
VVAVPKGLALLFTTRGVKRWLLPPLLLTATALILALVQCWRWLDAAIGEALPEEVVVGAPDWEWLEGLIERWEWVGSVVAALASASEWLLNTAYGLAANRVSGLILYLFLGALVTWYVFSIAYEAFAGPFLDEIQGRLETKWFGKDPRSSLERPTDVPAESCFRISVAAIAVGCVALLLGFLTPLPVWAAIAFLPVPFAAGVLFDRRYGTWLLWIAKVEGRAVVVSLKASVVAGLVLFVSWPLYFVPWVGYFLFATVCGFATAVTLLDIPCERRGWNLRQRLRLLRRYLLPFTAFGVVAGLLLAVPVLGPLLMVPSASLGGLWLLCRLDKRVLRPAAPPV